jgi:hypothetical protein
MSGDAAQRPSRHVTAVYRHDRLTVATANDQVGPTLAHFHAACFAQSPAQLSYLHGGMCLPGCQLVVYHVRQHGLLGGGCSWRLGVAAPSLLRPACRVGGRPARGDAPTDTPRYTSERTTRRRSVTLRPKARAVQTSRYIDVSGRSPRPRSRVGGPWLQPEPAPVVSEVRPDGNETYVQSGWVRGNKRKLDPEKSTLLEPVLSLRESDVSPMPPDQYVEVTIPLYYEGHAYRAGSRIRVTISAPNGDQPIWSFSETEPNGTATVSIAYSRQMPSRLLLPVVPGVDVPTGVPPCPGLRGQPCREY